MKTPLLLAIILALLAMLLPACGTMPAPKADYSATVAGIPVGATPRAGKREVSWQGHNPSEGYYSWKRALLTEIHPYGRKDS